MKAIMTVALALGFTLASQAQSQTTIPQSSEHPLRGAVERTTTNNDRLIRNTTPAPQVEESTIKGMRAARRLELKAKREMPNRPEPQVRRTRESLRRR